MPFTSLPQFTPPPCFGSYKENAIVSGIDVACGGGEILNLTNGRTATFNRTIVHMCVHVGDKTWWFRPSLKM